MYVNKHLYSNMTFRKLICSQMLPSCIINQQLEGEKGKLNLGRKEQHLTGWWFTAGTLLQKYLSSFLEAFRSRKDDFLNDMLQPNTR